MRSKPLIDHVAFLVSSIEAALAALDDVDLAAQSAQTFESEGTRECYLGTPSQSGRLLLIEAVDNGPYTDALEHRGPGLHHVALVVDDLDDFVAQTVDGSGWLVHPRSFQTRIQAGTIWLARPGVEGLVECFEGGQTAEDKCPLDQVTLAGLDIRDRLASLFADTDVPVVPGPRSGVIVDGRFVGAPGEV